MKEILIAYIAIIKNLIVDIRKLKTHIVEKYMNKLVCNQNFLTSGKAQKPYIFWAHIMGLYHISTEVIHEPHAKRLLSITPHSQHCKTDESILHEN